MGKLQWNHEAPGWVSYNADSGARLWSVRLSERRAKAYRARLPLASNESPPPLIGVIEREGQIIVGDVFGVWVLSANDGHTVAELAAHDGIGERLWFDTGQASIDGAPVDCQRFDLRGGRFFRGCGNRLFYFNGQQALVLEGKAPFTELASASFMPARDTARDNRPPLQTRVRIPVGPYIYVIDGMTLIR